MKQDKSISLAARSKLGQAVLDSRREGDASTAAWGSLIDLADHMEEFGNAPDDPVRTVFSLIGDRWSTLIIMVLSTGTWRNGALRRVLNTLAFELQISQRILTLKLRALERTGFVIRESNNDIHHPQTRYRLSDSGQEFADLIKGVLNWIEVRNSEIKDCCLVFDEGSDPQIHNSGDED